MSTVGATDTNHKHMRPLRTTLLKAALILIASIAFGCGGGSAPGTTGVPPGASGAPPGSAGGTASPAALLTAADVALGEVDRAMAEKGKTTYDVKCQACHSLGENRIVGPGWKGITTKRQPEWIMNMIMNTEAMLSADPEAQKMLEQCLVRMPDQNLTKDEAREVLEFMRTL